MWWLLGKGDDEIMHEMCILLFYNNYLCVNNVRYTKTMIRNPFITSGYVSADYFCDRQQEASSWYAK